MSVRLHVNGRTGETSPGISLFTSAEALDVRVPTSCNKQGKCKECVVEVVEGPNGETLVEVGDQPLAESDRQALHGIAPLGLLDGAFETLRHALQIFQAEFGLDRGGVGDGIDTPFHVSHVFVREAALS